MAHTSEEFTPYSVYTNLSITGSGGLEAGARPGVRRLVRTRVPNWAGDSAVCSGTQRLLCVSACTSSCCQD
jgi:hypothetical protein